MLPAIALGRRETTPYAHRLFRLPQPLAPTPWSLTTSLASRQRAVQLGLYVSASSFPFTLSRGSIPTSLSRNPILINRKAFLLSWPRVCTRNDFRFNAPLTIVYRLQPLCAVQLDGWALLLDRRLINLLPD